MFEIPSFIFYKNIVVCIDCIIMLYNDFEPWCLDIPNIEEYMKSLETSRRYLLDIWS